MIHVINVIMFWFSYLRKTWILILINAQLKISLLVTLGSIAKKYGQSVPSNPFNFVIEVNML